METIDMRQSEGGLWVPRGFHYNEGGMEFRQVDGVTLPPDWHKGDLAPQSTLLRGVGEPLRELKGGSAGLYMVYNSAISLTAAPVKQPTGTAIQTMMCIGPNANANIRIIEWGVSLDGIAAATPGEWTLIDTTAIFPTMTTAYAAADIQSYTLSTLAQNGATTAGWPLQIGSALSGFATTTVTEGTTTVARVGDLQLLPPTAPYVKQFPLGREFEQGAGHCLRIRCTTAASINAYCYVIFEA